MEYLNRPARMKHKAGRSPGRLAVLRRLYGAFNATDTGMQPVGSFQKARYLARYWRHIDTFSDWYGNANNPALQEALIARPSLVMCTIHPYISMDWSMGRKIEVIGTHYGMLKGLLQFLRFPNTACVPIAEIDASLVLQLEKPSKFRHEGELALSLFRNELRLFSLAFTLGKLEAESIAYVGALQGMNDDHALEIYRAMTRQAFGLRPRDLLIAAFRSLCMTLGVMRILGISNEKRISSNAYFDANAKVFSNYDAAWIEGQGILGKGEFFELNAYCARRTEAEMPPNKRAQYRRRYALLDDLDEMIRGAVRHESLTYKPSESGFSP